MLPEQCAIGRYWGSADRIELSEFPEGDAHIAFIWDDGARLDIDYETHASARDAADHLGFLTRSESAANSPPNGDTDGPYLYRLNVVRNPVRLSAILGIEGAPVKLYPSGEHEHGALWFQHTGQFRHPRAGEWYLSGAIPCAYRAPNDLGNSYHIMRPAALPPKRVTVGGFNYLLEGPSK